MKETRFIEQNKDKWVELERILAEKHADPDEASELFIQVSDDLSYARTYYKNRVVRVYLNQLTLKIFGTLQKNTVNHSDRFVIFWKTDLPAVMYHSRKELLFSLLLFVFCMLIGVLSSHYDSEFSRSILGASYVKTTNDNIQSGDPMAVYKDKDALGMFLYIVQNNLIVAYRTFLMGLFFAIGTVGSMMGNGIMVGVFQYYFISRGLFIDSALTIWMHGTMEIAAIIIAGGAGLVMGKGLVFPGTYTRLQSLRISARSGIKIMAGITPVIILAALIEGFITRYTELDNFIRLAFILLQATFVLLYFVIYPLRKGRKGLLPFRMDEQKLPATEVFQAQLDSVKTSSDVFGDSFRVYLQLLSKQWMWCVGMVGFYSVSMLFILNDDSLFSLSYSNWFYEKLSFLLPSSSAPLGWVVYVVCAAAMATLFGNFWRTNPELKAPAEERGQHSLSFVFAKFLGSCLIVFAHSTPLLIDNELGILIYLLILPFMLVWLAGYQISEKGFADASSLVLKNAFSGLSRHYSIFMSLGVIGIFFFLLSDSILPLIDTSVLSWNFRMDEMSYYWIKLGIIIFMSSAALFFLLPLLLTGMAFSFYSYREISEAHGLMERLQKHGFVKE